LREDNSRRSRQDGLSRDKREAGKRAFTRQEKTKKKTKAANAEKEMDNDSSSGSKCKEGAKGSTQIKREKSSIAGGGGHHWRIDCNFEGLRKDGVKRSSTFQGPMGRRTTL